MTLKLPTIEVNPPAGAFDASVIWLHGLGASGHDFLPVAEQLSLLYPLVRFVLPHAPMRAVKANQGLRMRAWYDFYSWNFRDHEDVAGLQAMEQSIDQLIEDEQALGIPSHRIVLAGFSQGGAMALYAGLRYPHRLGGIIALSTYVPDPVALADSVAKSADALPIFLAHGQYDGVIPLAMATAARQMLEACGCAVKWHCYAMEHNVVDEEIQDIAKFLGKVL